MITTTWRRILSTENTPQNRYSIKVKVYSHNPDLKTLDNAVRNTSMKEIREIQGDSERRNVHMVFPSRKERGAIPKTERFSDSLGSSVFLREVGRF